jgi:hypothetical protein
MNEKKTAQKLYSGQLCVDMGRPGQMIFDIGPIRRSIRLPNDKTFIAYTRDNVCLLEFCGGENHDRYERKLAHFNIIRSEYRARQKDCEHLKSLCETIVRKWGEGTNNDGLKQQYQDLVNYTTIIANHAEKMKMLMEKKIIPYDAWVFGEVVIEKYVCTQIEELPGTNFFFMSEILGNVVSKVIRKVGKKTIRPHDAELNPLRLLKYTIYQGIPQDRDLQKCEIVEYEDYLNGGVF